MRHLLRHRYLDYELIKSYVAKYVKPPFCLYGVILFLRWLSKRVPSDIRGSEMSFHDHLRLLRYMYSETVA